MSGNTAALEGLLVSPYLWPTIQYYDFYWAVYHLIFQEDKDLQGRVNAGSKQVLGTSNFVEMMGVDYWDILKRDEKGQDRYNLDDLTSKKTTNKRQSLVQLLDVIRDKYAHIAQYKDAEKERLNTLVVNGTRFEFFRKDDNGKYVLNKHQFIAFWNSKFPKLVPFLWQQLYKCKEKLPKYYPDHKINIGHFQKIKLDVTGYVEGLRNALTCDMENGNVLRRFNGLGKCSLEFREFNKLNRVLHGNEVVTMAINPNLNVLMTVSHSSTTVEVMEYIGNAPGNEKVILIFAANITDDEVWKNCKSVDCRVVTFSDPDRLTTENIEKAVAKFKTENSLTFEFSDSPIKGCELSEDKQNWLFEHGQVFVQGREMKIKDIFTDRSTMSEILSGNLLNKLLKRVKPTLFESYMYPEYKGVYIERKLSLRQNVNGEKFEHIYVTVNWSLNGFVYGGRTQVFNTIQHLEDEIDTVKSDCEFILFKEYKEISEEVIERCDVALYPRIVRFLDGNFDTLVSTNSRVARFCDRGKKARSCLSETEFLKIIRRNNTKTFFFRAESGMGKSKLLISLGRQIDNSLVIFVTFRQFVNILQKNVETTECTKANFKCVILEILGCKDECERNVIDHWLDHKGGMETKVELQLDGLDEVPSEHLNLALKSLKIIENDFDSVRLWMTSSRPFPSEMEEITFVEWNIYPFTFDDKVDFFAESWTATRENPKDTDVRKREEIISFVDHANYFTRTSIYSHIGLTDYPLFCSMIAELYKDNFPGFYQANFNMKSLTAASFNQSDLYESLAKKKFALMINGMGLDNNDNNFKFLEDGYMQVHKYFALVHLFPKMFHKFTRPSAMEFLTEENISKMRIITSIQPPSFVHGSYAHFFAAQFIIGGIKRGEVDNLCSRETFDYFLLSGMSDMDTLYMTSFLWKLVDSYLSKILDWHRFKWLDSQNEGRRWNVEYNGYLLTYTIDKRLWHLARLLINVQKNKMDSVECHEILEMAISRKAPSTSVIEMCEQFSFGKQKELLIRAVQNEQYDMAKTLIDICCGNGNDVFDEIAKMRKGGGGIFHFIVDAIENLQFPLTEVQEFIMYVQEKNPEEMKRKDNLGQNLLLALPLLYFRGYRHHHSEKILSLKKFLVEDLNADVNERSLAGESVLCFGRGLTYNEFYSEDAKVYHETLAFVASENFAHINLKSKISGLTPLQEAVHVFGRYLRKETLELFRDLGANFNELDKDGNTILHYCIKLLLLHYCWIDIEFFKNLVEYGSKIDVKNGDGLCALCFAEKHGRVELVTFFRERLKLRKDETCGLNCSIITE